MPSFFKQHTQQEPSLIDKILESLESMLKLLNEFFHSEILGAIIKAIDCLINFEHYEEESSSYSRH